MELATQDFQSEEIGTLESAAFKVEMNAMLFHSVIDGIYADKIRAPMRELATNARDGHAAAGNLDEPFDVFLPSELDPTFKVRDYGTSLSHEQVFGIFTTIFASSKRKDNLGVGMIGLGAKSPFAYTSIFTVTAYLDNKMRVYSAYIKEDGVPQIALLHEAATNERNGVEVSFAVKREDIQKFRSAAPATFFGFDPQPNILNETYVHQEPTVILSGPSWTLYDGKTVPFGSKLMARQGCVLYPIDQTALDVDSPLFNWPVVIDFPIGELSVATSREALGYDSKTRANLQRRMEAAYNEMAELVSEQVCEAETWIDACVMVADAMTYGKPTFALYSLLKSGLHWNGQKLQTHIKIDQIQSDLRIMHYNPDRHELGCFKKSVSHNPKLMAQYIETAKTFRDHTLIYFEPEDTKQAPSRMRRVIWDNDCHILWVRGDKDEFLHLLESLGGHEWTDLSTVEPMTLTKGEKTSKTQTFRYFTGSSQSYYYGAMSPNFENRSPDASMIYVKQEGQDFFPKGDDSTWVNAKGLTDWLYKAVQGGLLPATTRIYCLNKTNIKVLDEVEMIPLHKAIAKSIDMVVDFDAISRQQHRSPRQYMIQYGKNLLDRLEGVQKAPSEIKEFAKQAADMEHFSNESVSSHLTDVVRYFDYARLSAAINKMDPMVETQEKLNRKFPLLRTAVQTPDYFNHYMELLAA